MRKQRIQLYSYSFHKTFLKSSEEYSRRKFRYQILSYIFFLLNAFISTYLDLFGHKQSSSDYSVAFYPKASNSDVARVFPLTLLCQSVMWERVSGTMRPNQGCLCHVMHLINNDLSEPQGTCVPSICFESCPQHDDAFETNSMWLDNALLCLD
jgi:hypothetical protein